MLVVKYQTEAQHAVIRCGETHRVQVSVCFKHAVQRAMRDEGIEGFVDEQYRGDLPDENCIDCEIQRGHTLFPRQFADPSSMLPIIDP